MRQPEVAQVVCMLNNYPVGYVLRQDSKLKYIHRQNKKGCSEKFFDVGNCQTKYVAFLDDDFLISDGYFKPLIEAAEKYKGLVSYHGCILKKRPIQNYYKDRFLYHCRVIQREDKFVDVVGSGACLFEFALMKQIHVLYQKVENPNMSDIYLSALARANKMDCITIAHDDSMITAKPYDPADNYIFDRYRDDCQPQTNFINKYFR